jgi:hypothetical protein
MKHLSLLLIALLFAGCGLTGSSNKSPGDVALTIDQESYELGSTVTATLANTSDQQVGYNLCFSYLERKQDNDWVSVPTPGTCEAILKLLPPSEESQFSLVLADNLNLSTSGTYRIATEVEVEGEDITLRTEPFSIYAVVQQD